MFSGNFRRNTDGYQRFSSVRGLTSGGALSGRLLSENSPFKPQKRLNEDMQDKMKVKELSIINFLKLRPTRIRDFKMSQFSKLRRTMGLAKHIYWKFAILLLVLNLGSITAQVRPKAWAKDVPFVLKKGVQGNRSDKLANISFVWSGFKDEFYVVRVPTDNENDLPYFWDCKMTPLKLPLLCLSIFDKNDSGTIKIYAENYAVKEVKKETKKRVTRYKIITKTEDKSKPNEIVLEKVERNDNENFEFWNELLMACISGYMFPQNILSGLGKPVDDKEQIEQIQKLFENVWKYSKVMDDQEKLFYLDNIAKAILKGDIVNSDLALSFIKKTHEIAGLNEDERKSIIEDEAFVELLQQKREDEADEKVAIEALRQQEREKWKIDWTAVPELMEFIAETVNEYKATSSSSSSNSTSSGTPSGYKNSQNNTPNNKQNADCGQAWITDSNTYSSYETLVIKGNPDSDNIRAKMRQLRQKWEGRGCKINKSPYE